MTKPLAPDAQRKRQARSCLACRAIKSKCLSAVTQQRDGDEVALQPCERCNRLGTPCLFARSRRKGRPRRLPKEDDAASNGTRSTSSPPVKSEPSEDDFVVGGSGGGASRSNGSALSDEHGDDGQYLKQALAAGVLSPTSPTALAPVDITLDFFDPSHFHVSLGALPPPPSDTLLDLGLLALSYQTDVFHYLPLLPQPHAELVAYLAAAPPILQTAVASLVYPKLELHFDLAQLDATLAGLQAAIFFGYSTYGRNDRTTSRKLFNWAGTHILAFGWNQLDAPDSLLGTMYDHHEMDLIRRVFYEAWAGEITLSLITATPSFTLYFHPHNVFEPGSQKQSNGFMPQEGDSPFSIRMRATALAGRGSLPPSTPKPPLSEIATVCVALGLAGRRAFAAAVSAVDRESAFIATMIANQALIYLQSQSYSSSGFTCGLDSTVRPSREARSLTLMSSELIFATIRDSLASVAPVQLHSPFFSCALWIGANGALSTLRSKLLCTYQDDDEEFGKEVVNGGAGGRGGWDDELELEVDEEQLQCEWRAMALANNLDLIEAFLHDHTARWPSSQHILTGVQELRSLFVSRNIDADPTVLLLDPLVRTQW